MRPALVTGASGFVGWHVARELAESGQRVRAMTRGRHPVPELDVEVVQADLNDRASLERAVDGCGVVYHVAADYRLWSPNPAELYQSNVEGTRHLLEAAKEAGVERVVYTSTVGCIGFVEGGLGDETTPVSLAEMSGHYKRSKFLAEKVAIEFAEKGLPVVIVNPTAPVGDHDFKPTPTGQTIVDFLRGAMPAYLDTGLNIVDVRDVAKGHLLACQKGRVGERYILGGENLTLQQIFAELERQSGVRAPKIQIPYGVAWTAAAVGGLIAKWTGKPPRAPMEGVKMAKKKMWVTHAKATKELGYTPAPAATALAQAVTWLKIGARHQFNLSGR
ncbi:MAG: NAD-dependent epimerase/dehydratase family protein [Bryobacterales bacterium]|nr:NAD-dependent epimerase/dehydratase family protein [Bryobacterales bacterium]